ncbi:MAG: substrate-binding domain-containing protein, partial [Gluconacetobacter diazotrophicus]|nr:substrate-binding domain-containing protein [Gluconacetobacter diazotrophicus]
RRRCLAIGAALLAAAVGLSAPAVAADTRIALVVPGPNAYFDPWRPAIADAAAKYGFSGTFAVPPTDAFNLTQENALLDSLAARGYQGFGVFPGDSHGTNAEEAKLLRRGINTVNVNGCTYDPAPAAFCISADIYAAARTQAEELIKAIGGSGDIALLASQLTDPNTQLRIKAVNDAVATTGGKVKLAQVVADIDTPQLSPPAVNALLAARGNTLAGAMSTSYNPSIAMAVALTDNPQFRRIKFIGADAAPQVMEAVKAGIITGTLFQNTYGMAYAAAYALSKMAGGKCTVRPDAPFDKSLQTAKQLTSGVLLVTKDNVGQYPGPASLPDDTRRLIGEIDDKVLACH